MTRSEAQELREKVIAGETVQAAGGISVTTTQSDKLGYDWKIYAVNDIVVRKDYIEQEDPVGTSAENPIEYAEGVELIDNAYYRMNGKICVWMGEWVEWE